MYKPCLSPEMIKTSFSVVVTSVLVTDVDITIFGENLEVLVTVTDSFGVTRLKIVTIITQAINDVSNNLSPSFGELVRLKTQLLKII